MLRRGLIIGLIVGFCVPSIAFAMAFLLFNLPEGSGSNAFWTATNVLCPGWRLISGLGTFVVVSVLDGLIYALIGAGVAAAIRLVRRSS